jgi:hypothetical protein
MRERGRPTSGGTSTPCASRSTRTGVSIAAASICCPITVTAGLHESPRGRNIGEIQDVRWEGMRHQEVGQALAWYLTGLGLLEI